MERIYLTLSDYCAILNIYGYFYTTKFRIGDIAMKRIKTIETRDLCKSAQKGGCGECQTSCQSACKTSCGAINQQCENKNK